MATKGRDAARSRARILDAAERLFALRGFEGASLGEIAATAGLARATPSYFFGSKEELYRAVLERLFEAREEATARAFEPVVAWARGEPSSSLRRALTQAAEGYIAFLQERPAFHQLIQREGLAGAQRLRAAPRRSSAMSDAFEEVRAVVRARRLRSFGVDDAVLVFVSLTFSPLTQRSTFMAAIDRDLDQPATRRAHVRLVVDQVLHLIGGPAK